jgi:hypothetical protein
MNQFKIAFIVILIGLFSSGCYTTVYNSVDGDVYNHETIIIVPPPPPVYYPLPVPPPVYYPPPPNYPPPPPPEEYKTRPPENGSGDRTRDDGVVGEIRKKGGRGNDGSRR